MLLPTLTVVWFRVDEGWMKDISAGDRIVPARKVPGVRYFPECLSCTSTAVSC